jgi:hypothetical protein
MTRKYLAPSTMAAGLMTECSTGRLAFQAATQNIPPKQEQTSRNRIAINFRNVAERGSLGDAAFRSKLRQVLATRRRA